MLYLFLCFILSLLYSQNVALPTHEIKSNIPAAPNTKVNFTLPGDSLLDGTPNLLPKNSLLALEEEIEKPKKTSIVARKGVNNFTENHTTQKNTAELIDTLKVLTSKTSIENNASHSLPSKNITNINAKNATLDISKPTNKSQVKKPLIVSYEALVKADTNVHNELKIETNPSSRTLTKLTKTQIPSPNEEAKVKVYPTKANSHPDMIMPIVITILVVPMFAIIGYMALRRGQEAWKNRHYKRMDFLLDGMYND